MKSLLKQAAKRLGFEVSRIGYGIPTIGDFLRSRQIDLVLDVGANTGQFGRHIRALGYTGEIVSFEPVAAVFAELQKNTATDRNWSARNLAVGDDSGTATINVAEQSVLSSLLSQTTRAVAIHRMYGCEKIVRVETIQMERLDDIAREWVGRNVFLKIDTQGFERQVLEGARGSLGWLRGVQMEIGAIALYEGTWTLSAAVDHMAALDFVISQIEPVSRLPDDPASILEFDCIFRRA
jgi:FkbM family methyltransferase